MGVMQIMPATWAMLTARHGLGTDPFDVRANILGGAAYLRAMWERYGDIRLMLAAYNGQAEATRVILDAGGDPELANDRGQTPLAGAAFKGDATIAKLLLDHGAQVDGIGDGTRTALMTAAMFDRTEMVDLLLAHGADPDLRDASGKSAADMARAMGAQATPDQLDQAPRKGG